MSQFWLEISGPVPSSYVSAFQQDQATSNIDDFINAVFKNINIGKKQNMMIGESMNYPVKHRAESKKNIIVRDGLRFIS